MLDYAEGSEAERMPDAPRQAHIRVAVRVRPVPQDEDSIIEVAGDMAIAVRKEAATGGNEFLSSQQGRTEERMFDRVFGPDATQEEVYSWSCRPLIKSAIGEGRSATVFVYGSTGAGKTHTMFGEREEAKQGLIYRAVREVFRVLAHRKASGKDRQPLKVKLAFLDIYNETVRDLLSKEGGTCKVLEDERKGFVKVQNLIEVEVDTVEEALRSLRAGLQNRKVEATAANASSSRSHAVFSLTLEHVGTTRGHGDPIFQRQGKEVRSLFSRICLIDLAGSERATQTQNTGQALRDGAKINQSLLALANCIDALTNRANDEKGSGSARKKPPYRDSKLTLLLKGSLTSDCLVSMIANVHPGRAHFEDSNNTLEYAKRASLVKAPVLVRRVRAASLPNGCHPLESPGRFSIASSSSSTDMSVDEQPAPVTARFDDLSARERSRTSKGGLSTKESSTSARDQARHSLGHRQPKRDDADPSCLFDEEGARDNWRRLKSSGKQKQAKFEKAHTEPIPEAWYRAVQEAREAQEQQCSVPVPAPAAKLPEWHGGHVFSSTVEVRRHSGNQSSRSSTSSYSTARGEETMTLHHLHHATQASPETDGCFEVRASPGRVVSPLDILENSPLCLPQTSSSRTLPTSKTAAALVEAIPETALEDTWATCICPGDAEAGERCARDEPWDESESEEEAERQSSVAGRDELLPAGGRHGSEALRAESARTAEALRQESMRLEAERSRRAQPQEAERSRREATPTNPPLQEAAAQPPSMLRAPKQAGGRSPASRRMARSPSAPTVRHPALLPHAGAAAQDPRVLLAIIDTLQKDKACLDDRVNTLLQERRRLEKENAEHRAANLDKDRQIARLLASGHREEPRKTGGVGAAPTPARSYSWRQPTPKNSPQSSPRSPPKSAR